MTNSKQETPGVTGLHHVSAMAADPQQNLDFYVGVLGLRLVKQSVNQDDPGTYHFFYGDGVGSPGSALTFFPWPHLAVAKPGSGEASRVALAIPHGSGAWWSKHLASSEATDIASLESFGSPGLSFVDPTGFRGALIESDPLPAFTPWTGSPVPVDRQITGLHSVRLTVRDRGPTETVLERALGLVVDAEDGSARRWRVADGGAGTYVDVVADPESGPARLGRGSVHHVAWRVPDRDALHHVRAAMVREGLAPTPEIDRFWFRSVYAHEPGQVLLELATDGPGFSVDESALGERLILPPWLEDRRAAIERRLPEITLPEITLPGPEPS